MHNFDLADNTSLKQNKHKQKVKPQQAKLN